MSGCVAVISSFCMLKKGDSKRGNTESLSIILTNAFSHMMVHMVSLDAKTSLTKILLLLLLRRHHFSGYRPPTTSAPFRNSSTSSHSSFDNATSTAFSFTLSAVVAPGIGTISPIPSRPLQPLTHAIATCAAVHPFLSAIFFNSRLTEAFASKAPGAKRGR